MGPCFRRDDSRFCRATIVALPIHRQSTMMILRQSPAALAQIQYRPEQRSFEGAVGQSALEQQYGISASGKVGPQGQRTLVRLVGDVFEAGGRQRCREPDGLCL